MPRDLRHKSQGEKSQAIPPCRKGHYESVSLFILCHHEWLLPVPWIYDQRVWKNVVLSFQRKTSTYNRFVHFSAVFRSKSACECAYPPCSCQAFVASPGECALHNFRCCVLAALRRQANTPWWYCLCSFHIRHHLPPSHGNQPFAAEKSLDLLEELTSFSKASSITVSSSPLACNASW